MPAAVLGQDLRFAARLDAGAGAEMSATIPAEYMEAFFRYFAEGTPGDSKAAGVRALIPDFRCPRARAPGAAAGRGRRLGLVEAINEQLWLLTIHLPYHESGHVLNLACNVLTGGTPLGDIERLRRDVAYMNALGGHLVPDPTTAGDFCRRFAEADPVGVDGRSQLGAHEALARTGPRSARPRGLPRRGRVNRAHDGVTQAGRPGWPSP